MGRPLKTRLRMMLGSGIRFRSSPGRGIRIESFRCSQKMIAARVSPWQIRVAEADPAMPIRGNGPNPVIRIGLSTTSIEMARRAK
jgi:hypothetical protein